MERNERGTLFLLPHFHYDAAFMKTREEALELSCGHIIDVLYTLKKYEDYKFVLDQEVLVRSFLERYPEQKDLLLDMIRKKRLEIVGGMHVMADVNIPSGESFIRQILAGKRFCKEKLGVDVTIGWMLDTFGSHPQIPQLMKKAGFKYYCFARGSNKPRSSEFLWEGIDGTRILTHWMLCGALVGNLPVSEGVDACVLQIARIYNGLKRYSATNSVLAVSGTDDVFFKLNLSLVLIKDKANAVQDGFKVKIATPIEFFDSIKNVENKLEVVNEDLNPVFQGCYSSRIKLKQYNRLLENKLYSCEAFSTIAWLLGSTYPNDKLNDAWEPILFSHFHDVICGTGSDRTCDETIKSYGFAEKLIDDMNKVTLRSLAELINTNAHEIPIIVFNSLPWKRTDTASTDISFTQPEIQDFSMEDWMGNPVPCQIVSQEKLPSRDGFRRVKIQFIARDIPSLGYKVFHVMPGKKQIFENIEARPVPMESRMEPNKAVIENAFFRVEVDPWKGVIRSIKDKQQDWEVINQELPLGNTITKESDNGDPWEINAPLRAGETVSVRRVFPFPKPWEADYAHNYGAKTTVDTGPVYAEITIRGHFGNGKRESHIKVYRDIPRIDFSTKLINTDEWVRYRIAFPTSIKTGRVFNEIPFGAVKRGCWESPSQNWVDYTNESKGVAFLNRGIPGTSIVDGIFMLSVLRCTGMRQYGHQKVRHETIGAMEKNIEHTFEYALMPHHGDWKTANLARKGVEYNNPLIALKTIKHRGGLESEKSFIDVSPENIVVTAIKKNSDNAIIVRLFESSGEPSSGKIVIFREIHEAFETDLLENKLANLNPVKNTLKFKMGKFEIKTLALYV
jgi:alpha-mannosidase